MLWAPMERSILLLATALVAILYEAILLFTPLLAPYRFPIPYAVPIFDGPFALMAIGVAYLCLERHRLRGLGVADVGLEPDRARQPNDPAAVHRREVRAVGRVLLDQVGRQLRRCA